MARRYLTSEQMIAISYLSQPRNGGLSMEEIGAKCGVSRQSVYNWTKEPLFEQELKKEIVRNSRSRVAEVMESMADFAIREGNAAAAKLVLQANGLLTDRVEHVQSQPNQEIDYDKLDEEIEEFDKRFN
jgi:predicted DNA-binding protein YlxM (UPF0122 family)